MTTAPEPDPPLDVADVVASRALAVPGVVDLHTGTYGEVGTYLPGRRVDGVRVHAGGIEVHLTLAFGVPVLQAAQQVRQAVQPLTSGTVDVTVQDVVDAPVDGAGV